MTTTNLTPVEAGDAQPLSSPAPGALISRPVASVGQSGPAYAVRTSKGNRGWFDVYEVASGKWRTTVQGRVEAAKACRKMNGGAA